MGYHTDFYGEFKLDKPLTEEQYKYLLMFNATRRMKRDVKVLQTMSDPVREAVGLPIGVEGEYFVGGEGDYGQARDESILNYNSPACTQPGLWCKWTPLDNLSIGWDGAEKFYDYVEWIKYIIEHFLERWELKLNGEVIWQGEDYDDKGKIVVTDNVVKELYGRVVYEEN